MVDGGFTKEQLAMAKQLQAGYCSSDTFHSQNASQSPSGRSIPSQQTGRPSLPAPPVRMPLVTQPARSQAVSALRSSNCLVRPLPLRAPPSTSTPPSRTFPSGPVHGNSQPALKSAAQAPIRPTPAQPAPIQKPAPVKHVQQPAPKTLKSAAQPASKPTFHNTDLLSMEPIPVISTPTLITSRASHDTEMSNGGFDTVSQGPPVAGAAPESTNSQSTEIFINAPAVVRDAIKINKMGKPIKWNYMTEAPSVRELNPGEIEEMKPLPPPGAAEKLPWIRPWHPNQPLKVRPNDQVIEEAYPASTRPVIGLKGSCHAQDNDSKSPATCQSDIYL